MARALCADGMCKYIVCKLWPFVYERTVHIKLASFAYVNHMYSFVCSVANAVVNKMSIHPHRFSRLVSVENVYPFCKINIMFLCKLLIAILQ